MYDTKLVTAAQHGDEAAFAALFDRNVDGVYDLCFALVGEEGEASRLTALVFVLAARHLVDISDASQVRPWLLAITRDRVLAEDEAGTLQSAWGADSGAEASGGGASRGDASGGKPSGPEAEVEPLGTNELRRWVREAGATLALADQLVVELGTRYDLDPDQLIAAIGCRPDRLDSIVAQVEQEAEQVLGSLILARQGRKDCKRLAGLLAGWDGRPSVEVADVADRHAATCERCRRRRALVSPLELLAAAAAWPPPGDLRAQALEQAFAELPGSDSPPAVPAVAGVLAAAARPDATVAMAPMPPATPPTVPAAAPGGSDRPWGLIAAIGAAIVVLIVAVVLVLRSSPSSTKVASAPPSTTAALAPGTTTPATVAAAPVTIAPISTTTISSTLPAGVGSQLVLNTTSVDFGADATSAQIVLTDTGAGQAGWHAASPVPWLSVTPSSGFLQPAGEVQITFVINRAQAPNGSFAVTVAFVPSDAGGTSASLSVVGSDTEPTTTTQPATTTTTQSTEGPVISGVSASPTSIDAAPCPSDESVVLATVSDPGGVTSVLVDFRLPTGASGSAPMTQSGTTWSASIGLSPSAGTITYEVRATGADGRVATSPASTITVRACSI